MSFVVVGGTYLISNSLWWNDGYGNGQTIVVRLLSGTDALGEVFDSKERYAGEAWIPLSRLRELPDKAATAERT